MKITDLFGHNVRLYRCAKKMSQEHLANLCDLHRTYIGSIERGERNITLINVEKIAIALDTPISSFFDVVNHDD